MRLTRPQWLILYALGEFYQSLNQPLVEKPLQLQTSKITFIEHLLASKIITKQERAVYKNLELLEKKKLIQYDNKMVQLTEYGLKELQKMTIDLEQFAAVENYFKRIGKPHRKLQTVIRS